MKTTLTVLLCAALVLPSAAADDWPKIIEAAEGTLTVYQPQADSYEGDRLQGRAAVSWSDAAGGPRGR